MNDDILLVGEVAEVRGAKVKVRVYSQANEANVFFHGGLVRGVSVGGYLCMPCGFDSVIGVVEGDYQQESRVAAATGSVGREAPGTYLERYVDVSVFGSFSCGSFSRGVEVLPLVRTKVYLLAPEELAAVNSPVVPAETGFRVGALAGHNGVDVRLPLNSLFASHIGILATRGRESLTRFVGFLRIVLRCAAVGARANSFSSISTGNTPRLLFCMQARRFIG